MARTSRTAKGKAASVRLGWMDRFLEQLQTFGAIAPAAKAANVGRTTVYKQLKEDPTFKEQVDEVLAQCVELVESTLFQNAIAASHPAYVFGYLKARKPDVYGDKLRQDQIDQIRAAARQQTLAEVQEEIAQLPPEARKIVMAALAGAKKELTP